MNKSLPLKDLQHQFLDYLQKQQLNQPHALHDHVVDQGNINAAQRLEIYGNAYRIRLQKVIETDHPVLCAYLGDDLFDQLLQGYLQSHPSQVRSLRHFCAPLPEYLGAREPFSAHPILAELAAFESLLLDSFDAADRKRLDFSAVQALPAEQWPDMQLRLHPSVQFFLARWNSVESWQAMKAESDPPVAARIQLSDGQPDEQWVTRPWLVWRDRERLTQFRSLDGAEYELLRGVIDGKKFAELCELLLNWQTPDQIGQQIVSMMQRWFADGIVIAINQDQLARTH